MTHLTRLAPALAAGLLLAPSAHAKELHNRLAVGFRSLYGTAGGDVTLLSARWAAPMPNPAMNLHVGIEGGVSTSATTNDKSFVGGRVLYGVVAEDNMNLYLAGGAGLLSQGGAAGVRVQPMIATDFFPFGLENLGFSVEFGMNVDLADSTETATVAALGAHYWF